MRFTISAKSLATALSQVGKVQSGKYSSAVLELTYLRAEGGKVHLMACDAESKLFARKSISASVSEQGATLIDGKTLRALVQTFSAGQLTISSESGQEFAKVSWSGGSMSIPQTTDIKDYPAIARTEKFKGEDIAEYSCDSDMLKEGLSAVAYAQCKESNKPLMCSVLMDILKDSTSFVASNLQTLTIRRYATSLTESEEGAKLVLPTPFVSALSALLPKETACVNITHRNNTAEGWAKFAWNDTEVFGAMAVGKYPNYLAIIPKSADKSLEVSKETLLSALTRLSLTSDSLQFDIKEDASLQCRSLTIKAVSDILGTAEEIVQGSEYKGSPISVGLKTNNVMSVCRMLQGETITMELTDSRRAVLLKGSKTTEGVCDTAIVMPFTLRANVPAKTETPKAEEKKTEEVKEEVKEEVEETPEEVKETAVQVHDETPAEVADETDEIDEVEDETTEDEDIEEEEYEGSAV